MTVTRAEPPRSTAIYVAAFMLTGMVTTVLGPILPERLETWQLTDAAAGALFTAQFSGSLTAGALSGLLVSRLGEDRTLALGYGLMSAGLLALASGGYPWGVAGACAAGIGMGCVVPPTNLLVARGRREQAASALGALNFTWGIGAALWPFAVALGVHLGGTKIALGTLALLCAVASARIAGRRADVADRGAVDRSLASPPVSRIGLFAALAFLYSGTEMSLGGWLPELARRLPDDGSPTRAALVGSAFWAGLSAGRGLIALRLDRRYEDAALFIGLALTATAVGLLVTTDSHLVVMVAAAMAGLGLGPVFPVTTAALSREMPIRVGGPLLALGSLGSATLPWVVGAISDATHSLTTGVASLLGTLTVLAALHVHRYRGLR